MKAKIPYSIVVSFESLNPAIPVYQLFEVENRVDIEQQVTV
jgi:hypothetical protein